MVRTEGLCKYFSDPKEGVVRAVDGVTFEARAGEIHGLLGANGAGKTTILRMLSTILRPTAGYAFINGLNVLEDPQKVRASIGFMSTSTALYGRLRAIEMLRYFGELYGLRGRTLEHRLTEIIEKLQIGEFADRMCEKLSTGEKQRVNIGRTILHDPSVLFFDEPTAGLDVLVSQTVLEFIEDARAKGKTVVLCSHIMSEVERVCDRVTVIHQGKVGAEGTVEDIKNQTQETNLERAFLKIVRHQAGQVSL
jgi:sodium transport system ATP-binding protein